MNKNTYKLFNNKISGSFLLTIMAVIVVLFISGCSKDIKSDVSTSTSADTSPEVQIIVENYTDAENTTAVEDNTQDVVDSPNYTENSYVPAFSSPYIFYDVFRTEHEMELNTSVPVNLYNPDNYSYVDIDAIGNRIAESTDAYACNTKPSDDPSVQMQGYTGIIKYDDEKYTSKFGIDVSKFQGNIDWNKVKEAGVEFVFVRVGFRGYGESGSLKEDAYYKRNIEGATAAGLDVGVYFYAQAINEEEAIEEADFVLNLISDYNLSLPIVYDPEHVLNDVARTDNISGEQFTKNARAFSDKIMSAGLVPMIYANMMWEAYELDLSYLSDVPIWYADYENKPQTPYNFTTWQYSQAGKIQGINGTVDLNLMIVEK